MAMGLLFSKWSCSAAIAIWKDSRTTAPMYFFMGNPFLIVPRVFEHSINRLHVHNVARLDCKLTVIQKNSCNSMKINGIQWKPLKFNGNLCKSTIFPKILGHPCNIRAMKSIDRVPKHSRLDRKWIPHEKIRRSCGAKVLPTRNSRRARPFWK